MQMNETALNELLGRAIVDCGGAWHAPLVVMGGRLGLYKALAESGPMTPEDLASRTSTAERYVREWLNATAASGYISYQADTGRYYMTPEQASAFADENSPVYLVPAFEAAVYGTREAESIEAAFRTGEGFPWRGHHRCFFGAVERFFRTGYQAHLVTEWIPSLDGVAAKLEEGARVADIGCGHGASTIIMARAWPRSMFFGFDFHEASIATATERAAEAGVASQVKFSAQPADAYDGMPYEFVTTFDALHDMGDPVSAAKHVRRRIAGDGTWMVVEPAAADRVENNLNPVGRLYYSASTLVCTPCSLAQEGRMALGAQAGEARIREVALQGGFTRFRRAAETPFNVVYEIRP
jgi:SAM-dependent methyltransferase